MFAYSNGQALMIQFTEVAMGRFAHVRCKESDKAARGGGGLLSTLSQASLSTQSFGGTSYNASRAPDQNGSSGPSLAVDSTNTLGGRLRALEIMDHEPVSGAVSHQNPRGSSQEFCSFKAPSVAGPISCQGALLGF